MRVTSVRRQSRARLPGRGGAVVVRDGREMVRARCWERAPSFGSIRTDLDQFAPHAHLSLNLFCTMAAQVSVDYDTFLKDRLVTADERPQWVS